MNNNNQPSISLIMAMRNERDNVEPVVRELNNLDECLELIFVEGHSVDGTFKELQRVSRLPWRHEIQVLKQDGIGKKDAVVKGLKAAKGDIVFVYDADGEISTAELPLFFQKIKENKNLCVACNRFVYPMEKKMAFINRMGNYVFSFLASAIIGKYLKDPLCGLKGCWRGKYIEMMKVGAFDNDFDRFAEFDQVFGAARVGLRIEEIPVRYKPRRYGDTKVKRFETGMQLLKRSLLEIKTIALQGRSTKP